ncbi:MAG TPA: FAD-dependent oxidoreductase, partial [Actinomycetota bacterium]|nr:FAD-dependent oxidoreductase [Actinomycetota bacterium]
MSRPTVVIVGANLAGGRAAEALRAEGYDGRILLIGEEPYRPYERPPLSKELLRGEWPEAKAFLREEQWYADNDVEMLLGTRVTMVDPVERSVMAGGALYDYNRLLLATGGRPRVLPVPGAELSGVHTLRTIDDAVAIGSAVRSGARVAIIGAGFIGCEVAASARALGADVHLVDVLAVPMVRGLGEEIGAVFAQIHADHGVRLHLGTGIERIEGASRVERVVLSDGTSIDADVVVMGVGIEPADELAHEAGLAT